MKQINTAKAPAAIGPYSQAIEVNGFVYTSGQLPIDPATGAFPEGGVQAQTRQSLMNVKAILEEAGLGLQNVVKTTVFLANMSDFAAMNEIYAQFFSCQVEQTSTKWGSLQRAIPCTLSIRSERSP